MPAKPPRPKPHGTLTGEWRHPALARLAANAQEMTPELWEALKQGYRHAPLRPEARSEPSYARMHHGQLPLYSRRAVKLG